MEKQMLEMMGKMMGSISGLQTEMTKVNQRMDILQSGMTDRMETIQSEMTERMDTFQSEVTGRMDMFQFETTSRFDQIDSRLDSIDEKLNGIGLKFEAVAKDRIAFEDVATEDIGHLKQDIRYLKHKTVQIEQEVFLLNPDQ